VGWAVRLFEEVWGGAALFLCAFEFDRLTLGHRSGILSPPESELTNHRTEF